MEQTKRLGVSLVELVELICPELGEIYDTATSVLDWEIDPPSEWEPEIEERRAAIAAKCLTDDLRMFDEEDFYIAATRVADGPKTDGDFIAWKQATPDWKALLKELRARDRAEFEADRSKYRWRTAKETAARQIADRRRKVANDGIENAIRTALDAAATTVRATNPETGATKDFSRIERRESTFDRKANTLTLNGKLWCQVDIEFPNPSAGTEVERKRLPPAKRRLGRPPRAYDLAVSYIEREYGGLVPDDVTDLELQTRMAAGGVTVSLSTASRARHGKKSSESF